MNSYPYKINNGGGEEITFLGILNKDDGEYLEIENKVKPGAGPPMHVHLRQTESLTVINGRMAAQVPGKEPVYYNTGESVVFQKGEAHKFWNAGEIDLICKGWIHPAENVEYFLTQIFKSAAANGGKSPSQMDAAFLMTKYKKEFDMTEIPSAVKMIIFPVLVLIGKALGRYKKYEDSPKPY